MNKVRCSVIIPTRNCLAYLGAALSSVSLQGLDDIEIIVVDDGSSDGTDAFLAKEAQKNPQLVVLQGPAQGPSVARNLALEKARAPLIAFLDADDLWWPGKLQRQLAFHETNPAVAFSFTDYLHVDMEGGLRGTCFDFWKPAYVDRADRGYHIIKDAELELLAVNTVGTSTVVASRDALQNANGFANRTRSAEDWKLWLDLASLGPVACSSMVTMTYLMRPDSVTRNRQARIDAMRDIIRPYETKPAARAALRKAHARIAVAEAELARGEQDDLRAALAHMAAFGGDPNLRVARAALADLASLLRTRRKAA